MQNSKVSYYLYMHRLLSERQKKLSVIDCLGKGELEVGKQEWKGELIFMVIVFYAI